ncbi:MAG: PTS sugar transporter subunit IIA [Pseudomonadales bacterium]
MLDSLLMTGRIQLNASIVSKKKSLQTLSCLFAENDKNLNQDLVFDAFTSREKLGSTALENGIAIPHCRFSGCTKAQSAILTLDNGIDFDARDGKPVDLLWALIVPEESTDEHLAILALMAKILSQEALCLKIRQATDANSLKNMLTQLDLNE